MSIADNGVRNYKRAALTLLRQVARSLLSDGVRRELRELRESRYVSHCPDRIVLLGRILPALAKSGSKMLWVGCLRYTRRYPAIIERQVAACWTLEIDPAYADALHRVVPGTELIVVTWLHRADRSVLQTHPRDDENDS